MSDRTRKMIRLAMTFLLALPIFADQARAGSPEWKAGVAEVVITPERPQWMAGYAARTTPSEGKIHDLYAKALALESSDGARMVVVTSDLISIPREFGEAVAEQVERRYGLPRARLLLNASHTHCGPELRPSRVGLWGVPMEWADRIETYVTELEEKVVGVVGQALANLEPARLFASQSSADFARNRRFPTENGFVNRQYDDGPTDHTVPVLRVVNADGKTTAILFGYACHNTVLSFYQFCGDYAGFAQRAVQEAHPGAKALFVAGAGGDQNPYPRRELEYAKQHGEALADAVNRALAGQQTEVHGPLRVARADALLEFQPLPPRSELEKQTKSTNRYIRRKAEFLIGQLDSGTEIDLTYKCPVQVARLGDEVLLIAIGGEVVVDYALRIRKTYNGGPMLWVAGYSNDVFGYLPSLRVLREGGYEGGGAMTYTRLPGPFTETVESRVFETVDHLVKKVSTEE